MNPGACSPTPAWVGLGSNIGDGPAQLAIAVDWLHQHDDIQLCALSSIYRSAPWGRAGQADFHNAVARVQASCGPEELLDILLAIEHLMGRERRPAAGQDPDRWGPRLIDLDLLLYGRVIRAHERLVLPHPRMHERRFVLAPLTEISPGVEIPGQGKAVDRLPAVADQAVEAVEKFA